MQWREITIHTNGIGSDIISNELMNLGAAGTEVVDREDVPDPSKPGVYWELYDPKLLESMPEDVLVKGWFELNEKLPETLRALQEHLNELRHTQELNLGSLTMDGRDAADEDWSEVWKQFYKPFRVGSRLVVKPQWEQYQAQPDDLIIEMDPGMAFGTGTHETTNMCLQLVEKYMKSGTRVMDVGTGSGILAIAAAMLGAKEVLAIDIDPNAVKVAKENIANNHVENKVRVVVGDLCKSEAMPCELAVANIVADAICMLSLPLTKHLLHSGLFICSGIIREREKDVREAVQKAGYSLVDRIEKGEWVALCLRNSNEDASICD